MNTVAVIGGTGVLGKTVVERLSGTGEVRILCRNALPGLADGVTHSRIDLESGEGLDAALEGVDTIVDAANPRQAKPMEAAIVEGTRRLLERAAAAGVRHYVGVSILGCNRVPFGYYRAKAAQEEVIAAGPVEWSLLRATQFHQFLDSIFASAAARRIVPTGSGLIQPIDVAVVAGRLGAAVEAGPSGRLDDIGGPAIETISELSRAWRRHDGRRLLPIRLPMLGKMGRSVKAGELTDPSAAVPGPGFEEWLEGSGPDPSADSGSGSDPGDTLAG